MKKNNKITATSIRGSKNHKMIRIKSLRKIKNKRDQKKLWKGVPYF